MFLAHLVMSLCNHALSVVCRCCCHWRHWRWHQHLCTALPVTGLITEVSYLTCDVYFCLPEAGDIVMLPMKSVSLVVAYSSMLFPKLFHSPALPGAPLNCLSPFGRLASLEVMCLFKWWPF